MSEKTISEILQDCYNHHCHSGEFSLFGKHIIVFTKEPVYPIDENGLPNYDEEPISYGGDKCAFIDDTYWSGWYEQDLGNDLYYCMKDVTKHLFESDNIKFTITGTLNSEKNTECSDEECKQKLLNDFNKSVNIDTLDIQTINIIEIDRINNSFKIEVTLHDYALFDFFKSQEDLINKYVIFDSEIIETIEYSYENKEEIKKYFNDAFSYSISL